MLGSASCCNCELRTVTLTLSMGALQDDVTSDHGILKALAQEGGIKRHFDDI